MLRDLDAGELSELWDRFEVFEALHHSLTICNPMSSQEVDEVLDAALVAPGGYILDLACGSGEYLLRSARRAPINGLGIDLSPWMVTAAHRRSQSESGLDPSAQLTWLLGDAKEYRAPRAPDVAVCLGAEWVWHDFRGTARALSSMLEPGGISVIGAARLHHRADPDNAASTHGVIDTIDDMAQSLAQVDLVPLHRVDPSDAGWDSYLARTRAAAAEWREHYPGERSEMWVADQAEWWTARQRDRAVIGWSVWVAQKRRSTE